MNRLRIGTYNVHKCRGLDWRVRLERIAKVICELNADLLAVQEIFRSQAESLTDQVKMQHVFGTVRQLDGRDYGNAVFSRFPVAGSEQFDLTVEGCEPRACLRVSAATPEMQFFAVHLGTSFFERRKQAARLVEILQRPSWKSSRIVAGDFNEWTHGLATKMLSSCLRSADAAEHPNRRRTYPGVLPFLHLDHIYYDREFHLTELHVHRSPAALVASDHLPLIATFTRQT